MLIKKICLIVALLYCGANTRVEAGPRTISLRMDDLSVIKFDHAQGPNLEVQVKRSSDLVAAVQLYTGHFSDKHFSLEKLDVKKLDKKTARIPFLALSPGFKRLYIQTLWPKDRIKGSVLVHKAIYPAETFWTVSQLYTGYGNNYTKIKQASSIQGEDLKVGMTLKIPAELVLSFLKDAEPQVQKLAPPLEEEVVAAEEAAPRVSAPVAQSQEKKSQAVPGETLEPASGDESENSAQASPNDGQPGAGGEAADPSEEESEFVAVDPSSEVPNAPTSPRSNKRGGRPLTQVPDGIRQQLQELETSRRELRYGRDNKGSYAEYRLKKGEAIYSSVVVRFCGLVRAQEVNALAQQIITRNGIRDVTDMAIGERIRIPYEFLEDEYRMEDDKEYQSFVQNLDAVSKVSTFSESRNLEGVTIILDAGHGGRDPGADRKRVWEDDYVYDILCRAKKRLEEESAAKVETTILDLSNQYQVQDATLFRRDQDEVLLTSPQYPLSDAKVTSKGVNLRWVIANNRLAEAVARGTDPGKVLFASFHADALHSSIRGAMVYVPDARHIPGTISAAKMGKFKDTKGNKFNMNRKELQEAQARSTQFASNFIKASQERDIRTHSQKPIRSLIYRNPTKPYVPAVLKYNRVPTRVLVEVCNINNVPDQDLLKDPDFRQKVADAFVVAVFRSYGGNPRAAINLPRSSQAAE